MIPRRWLIFFSVFICIPAILYFVPRWIVDTWSYARWDNFECNLPTLAKAHSTLLQGVLPRINFSEHLGEPLPASIQTGIFYFPYTIAVAFIKSAHLPWNELGAIVYAMHMAWAFIGTVLFLRELRVRSSLAVSFAALACCGGWIQMLSGIWVFVMPCFSWLPWMLLGTLWITQGRRPVAGGWLIAIGTASLGCIGYPQIGAYCGLFFLIVSVIGILVVTRDVRKLQAMAFSTLAGVLLSLPAILPFLFQLPETVRGQRIPESSFMEASVAGRSLVGLFTPLVRVDNGFLIQDTSIPLFQGVMVPFFLMIALARLLMKRRKLQASEINLTRWTSVLIGISALFLILALGASTPVYRWTYWIPIWSSFRWPHKILSVVQWGLPVSAALSAEIYCRSPVTKVRLGFFISTLIAGLFLGTTLAWPAELANRPLGYAVLGVSLVSLGLAPWISHRLPRYAFEDYNNKEFPPGSNGSTKGGDHSASDARE